MIKLEKTEVMGFDHAIRGMRNPMNSWELSDSKYVGNNDDDFDMDEHYEIGPNDHKLMMKLVKGGPVHAKFRRMITVYVDITAPLYWWKEFDTYKVGTVANSCSTMHKIQAKEFTLEDFSCEHLLRDSDEELQWGDYIPYCVLENLIIFLNKQRVKFIETNDKKYWWQMIQLLPSSYNQKRTIMLNYEVLSSIYGQRRNHKLDEWVEFCEWIDILPYNEIIKGETPW